MKPNPVWRVFLVLVVVSLACTFTSNNDFLPPTETPRPAPTDAPIDEDDQDQQDADDEDQGDEDIDLDQDLDLGGLGDQDEDQDEDQQDQDEDQDQQDEDQQDQDEQDQDQDQGDDCSPFRASSDVFWVTLDEDFEIQEQVASYPSGTTLITPVFEYECVPTNVDIVSVFSYDGEVVYSDEESIQPSTSSGIYGYPLGTTDDTALGDGEWGIEFYVDEDLIGDGTIDLGGGNGQGQDNELVTVEGSVVSASSGQAIEEALVLILVPGVTIDEWIDADYPDSDVYTGAETNSRGEFTLADPLERNVEYALVVVADGYQPLAVDGFVIGDDLEAPVFLEIELAQ